MKFTYSGLPLDSTSFPFCPIIFSWFQNCIEIPNLRFKRTEKEKGCCVLTAMSVKPLNNAFSCEIDSGC